MIEPYTVQLYDKFKLYYVYPGTVDLPVPTEGTHVLPGIPVFRASTSPGSSADQPVAHTAILQSHTLKSNTYSSRCDRERESWCTVAPLPL